jgi:heat shock protein HslJ
MLADRRQRPSFKCGPQPRKPLVCAIRPVTSIAVAVLVLGLAACGDRADSNTIQPDPETIQGAWVLESMVIHGEPYEFPDEFPPRYMYEDPVFGEPISDAPAFLRFDDTDVIEGRGPCNGFSGTYEFDGQTLVLDDVTQTAALCTYQGQTAQAVMDAEVIIMDMLRGNPLDVTFTGANAEIMQWTQDGTVAVFHREPEHEDGTVTTSPREP